MNTFEFGEMVGIEYVQQGIRNLFVIDDKFFTSFEFDESDEIALTNHIGRKPTKDDWNEFRKGWESAIRTRNLYND